MPNNTNKISEGREGEKIVTIIMQAIAPYHKPYEYLGEKSIETAKNEIMQTHHQELQKARHDWLREEIVKLEGMKIKELPSSLDDTTGFVMGHSKNITIQTIIDRYQSELDQPITSNKTNGL
jgi:hypothetical protein